MTTILLRQLIASIHDLLLHPEEFRVHKDDDLSVSDVVDSLKECTGEHALKIAEFINYMYFELEQDEKDAI
jgi:hypothetical protein